MSEFPEVKTPIVLTPFQKAVLIAAGGIAGAAVAYILLVIFALIAGDVFLNGLQAGHFVAMVAILGAFAVMARLVYRHWRRLHPKE